MKSFFIVNCLLLSILVLQSCYSFEPVSIQRKNVPGRVVNSGDENPDTIENALRPYDKAADRTKIIKFFARIRSSSPVSIINNRAVDLSIQERYNEAEILFKEVIAEDSKSAAGYNNLGVIYDLLKNNEEAFRMYTKACQLEPEITEFRKNLMTFTDYREK
jgi:tetratricopeptide (TPR) repeat protein